MKIFKIIIADDHQLIVDGIKLMLENNNNYKIIAGAENGSDLIIKTRILNPDLILIDIDMPIVSGEDAVKIIKKEFPDIKILVLSMHNDFANFNKMKNAGANGFIHKNIDKDELIFAMNQIINGKEYISSVIHKNHLIVTQNLENFNVNLTKREIEIIKLIALGHSNYEIGEKLFISIRTVDTHRTNIMRKLKINNVAGLIRFAYSSKLVDI